MASTIDLDATPPFLPEADVEDLIAILAREGDLLERLLHKVTVTTLLLASGEQRFLATASDEVDEIADAVASLEIAREVAADTVAERLGIARAELTLRRIIAAAPAAYRPALEHQHERLSALSAELEARLKAARELSGTGLGDIQAKLERMATGSRDILYGAGGQPQPPPPTRFDERA